MLDHTYTRLPNSLWQYTEDIISERKPPFSLLLKKSRKITVQNFQLNIGTKRNMQNL